VIAELIDLSQIYNYLDDADGVLLVLGLAEIRETAEYLAGVGVLQELDGFCLTAFALRLV